MRNCVDLSGKVAIVTGANSGIGKGVALELAAAGARVVVNHRPNEDSARRAAEVVQAITQAGGAAVAGPADISREDDVERLFGIAQERFQGLDILVNNAGIDLTQGLFDYSHQELADIATLNLVVPMELTRQAVPGMIARGRGHIVNMSSMAGTAVLPGMAPYAATKSALTHFTSGLRAELRGLPVRTTVAEVGLVGTDMRESVIAYPPTAAGFRRLYRLRLLPDTPVDRLCDAVVAAVRADRRHVRLPRRASLFSMLPEAPRRMLELILTGVRARP